MDLEELKKLVLADVVMRGQPISKLGYFCLPFRPPTGPFKNHVIKVYRGLHNKDQADRLILAHDAYVEVLQKTGVEIPNTQIALITFQNKFVPVVVQHAYENNQMMREIMISGDRIATLNVMQSAGEVIARFWNNLDPSAGRVGFHPSIRNFAIENQRAIFFDTFPPLIGYSRQELGQLLLTFSESKFIRLIGPFLKTKVTGIQDEWYSPSETLIGLVGSACRLRPEFADLYLKWGREFAQDEMPRFADDAILSLATPPKLPNYWTSFRKILGLQGQPNI